MQISEKKSIHPTPFVHTNQKNKFSFSMGTVFYKIFITFIINRFDNVPL